MASVTVCVCVRVRALKEKRLELSTPNLVDTQHVTAAGHALTRKSRGYELPCQRGFAGRYGRCYLLNCYETTIQIQIY